MFSLPSGFKAFLCKILRNQSVIQPKKGKNLLHAAPRAFPAQSKRFSHFPATPTALAKVKAAHKPVQNANDRSRMLLLTHKKKAKRKNIERQARGEKLNFLEKLKRMWVTRWPTFRPIAHTHRRFSFLFKFKFALRVFVCFAIAFPLLTYTRRNFLNSVCWPMPGGSMNPCVCFCIS